MTQDQIRKLLGGYATNTLTADERRILFEAALEDQDLFNALENEDALRELLDDPMTRDHVRKALEASRPEASIITPKAGFSWRRWMFGVAVPAMVAVIVIAVMYRPNAPQPITPQAIAPPAIPPQTATSQPQVAVRAPTPQPQPRISASRTEAAARPETKKQSAMSQAPAPVNPSPVQRASAQDASRSIAQLSAPTPAAEPSMKALTAPVATSFGAGVAPPIPDSVRQQFSSGTAANAPHYQGPLVSYSLVRSGPDGNALRVEVSTRVAGYLALYQMAPTGELKRVYPANDVAASVVADRTIQIPSDPIKIADAGMKLRLVVVPVSPSAALQPLGGAGGGLGGAVGGVALGTGNAPLRTEAAPLVVDIPLAP